MNQEDISRFICRELPRHHLQSMLESIEAAFNQSDRHLKETYQHVPLAGPGPQSHHFMVQEALLALPGDESFEVINRATRPAGGHFALIRAGALQITTSVVTIDRAPPVRDAKFRRDLRMENARLQQQHPDLFQPFVPPFGPNEDALHALLLPHTAKWSESDHGSPLGCVIAVPYSDHRARFHLWAEVDQLWQYYDEEDDLPDIAYPTLRDRMRDAESEDQSEGGNE
ncbi:hypothetical protein [Halomonas sp. H5]|uniref:hypothetical protein n=1 Tax=Halomonas sp. H5 TaxID=3423910 RepID=UPI003D36A350